MPLTKTGRPPAAFFSQARSAHVREASIVLLEEGVEVIRRSGQKEARGDRGKRWNARRCLRHCQYLLPHLTARITQLHRIGIEPRPQI